VVVKHVEGRKPDMRRREFITLLGGAVRRQPDARSRHPLLGVPFGCAVRREVAY
jgi:hypothetical protein